MWTGKAMIYDDKNVIECLRQQRFYDTKIPQAPREGVWVFDHIGEGSAFMLFTGLKDKNGKDIFEGDIVKWVSGYLGKIVWWEDRATFSAPHLDGKAGRHGIVPKYLEVIGNIYENPELLDARKI